MSVPAPFPAWLKQVYEHYCRQLVPGAMLSETVAIDDAVSRVTAVDVIAPDDVPSVPLAACDGYALRASDTARATHRELVDLDCERSLGYLASRTANPAARALAPGHAASIPAYVTMPEHADTLAPTSTHRCASADVGAYLRFRAPYAPGQHVIAAGSEYRKGDVLLEKGLRITPARQAALIAAGVREVAVTKRPRIGIVIAGYEVVPPGHARESWQRYDSCGPYVRAILRQWGYDVPAVEYLPLPSAVPWSADARRDDQAFGRQLAELAGRYDLIVGAGLPAGDPFQIRGLNSQMAYPNSRDTIRIKQTPGGIFNVGRSMDRSPPKKWLVEYTRPNGYIYRSEAKVSYDQAVLVNLPGHTSGVAVLMHAIVRYVLDSLEHVASPGPHWETALTAHDIAPDAELNGMRWGVRHGAERGESRVSLLPCQGDGPIRAVTDAEVLVAIPAGETVLPAGTPVLFVWLDRTGHEAPRRGEVKPPDTATDAPPPLPPQAADTDTGTGTLVADATVPDVRESWQHIENRIDADPKHLPGGLNGPASAHAIAALHGTLGTTLPDDLLESLRLHDGQADPATVFAENDALLSAHEIIAQWSIWKKLVSGGDFDDMTSDPAAGIRDDWYNLKWIPFTHDGSGNHLCVDLDPAEGGTVGQVIRVWHDDDRRERVASSYAEWLARVAAERDDPAGD
ncbi:molybdopterin biosynthesis moeA protein [Burkholderia aenigmatica]|uniref:Molybdopterin molybdenumtransferase n=1 Tax=Burkholderia aenigmatica TaxID=2015348 RepID=A0A6P2ITN6_9BURK|nr:SMI1/KNR4 family protein [Burkholderia aenigmatica]VWB32206.1 molybdopterin biosynthesis moeA protein [Burkholderia aenigmatica]